MQTMDCSSVRKLSKANSIGQHWRHGITLESRKCPGSSFPLFHLYCLSEGGGVLLYWDRVSRSSPGWPPIYNSLPPPGKRDLQVCASTFRFLSYFYRNIKKDALGHLCLWEGSVTQQKIQQKQIRMTGARWRGSHEWVACSYLEALGFSHVSTGARHVTNACRPSHQRSWRHWERQNLCHTLRSGPQPGHKERPFTISLSSNPKECFKANFSFRCIFDFTKSFLYLTLPPLFIIDKRVWSLNYVTWQPCDIRPVTSG